jgi:hypothetical protein
MSQQKEREELTRMLRRLAIEKRPFACIGCGLEHRCSLHGCAVLLRTADIISDKSDKEEPENAGADRIHKQGRNPACDLS